MKIDAAKAAAPLAAEIDSLVAKLALIDLVINENFPITRMEAMAPAEGASLPAGTVIDLLPGGKGDPTVWKIVVSQARNDLQTRLGELTKQLEAL